MARAAALALAAGEVVDERDASAAGRLGDDLVPEHRPGRGGNELLDVASAEPAGADPNALSRAVRLRNLPEPRVALGVDDDRAHDREW